MSRFARIYEDPSYDDIYDSAEDLDLEVKPFEQWDRSAQNRLIKDVVKQPQSGKDKVRKFRLTRAQ